MLRFFYSIQNAVLKKYRSLERNGLVYVWYHQQVQAQAECRVQVLSSTKCNDQIVILPSHKKRCSYLINESWTIKTIPGFSPGWWAYLVAWRSWQHRKKTLGLPGKNHICLYLYICKYVYIFFVYEEHLQHLYSLSHMVNNSSDPRHPFF